MYKNLYLAGGGEGLLINGNGWQCFSIRLQRVTSKNADYIFEELSMYI